MKQLSGWGSSAIGLLVLTFAIYLGGVLLGRRMANQGEGWEMAFYLSPIVFMLMRLLLFLAICVALTGALVGSADSRHSSMFITIIALTTFVIVWLTFPISSLL